MHVSELSDKSVFEQVEDDVRVLWWLSAAVSWFIVTLGVFELRETGKFVQPDIVYVAVFLSGLMWLLRFVVLLLRRRSPFDEKLRSWPWSLVVWYYLISPTTNFQLVMTVIAAALVAQHSELAWWLMIATNGLLAFTVFRFARW